MKKFEKILLMEWVQILLIFIFGIICIVIIAINSNNYDKRQNKTQNVINDKLY